MAARRSFVICVVRARTTVLTVNVAREVPVKIETGPSNSGIRCLGNNAKALLINILEHERGVVPTELPARIIQWVRGAVEHADFGMEEFGEIIVVSVYDDGTLTNVSITNSSAVEAVGGFPTDSLGESESEETDTSHKQKDKADESHLLSPCSLSFGTPKALAKEDDQMSG